MSEGTQKYTIPRYIEPRRFAQQGVELRGNVNVEEFSRLVQAGLKPERIWADLVFAIASDFNNEKAVRGKISVDGAMQCQRCLGDVSTHIECDVAVAAIWHEDSAKDLPVDLDPWIVPDDEADLHQMIEEEVLLNLPIVAFHDEDCIDRSLMSTGDSSEAKGAETNNPFQVLEKLKGKQK